jgi:hypothetical protein
MGANPLVAAPPKKVQARVTAMNIRSVSDPRFPSKHLFINVKFP